MMRRARNDAEYRKMMPGVKPDKTVIGEANPRFRDPAHFQIKNPRWKVCQGFITVGSPEIHCWLEYGGIVLDLFFGYRMPADQYYKVHHCRNIRRYSKPLARRYMDTYKTYKWLDKEEL